MIMTLITRTTRTEEMLKKKKQNKRNRLKRNRLKRNRLKRKRGWSWSRSQPSNVDSTQKAELLQLRFTPDPNVSFDVDIGTSGSSMNENKKNAPDQIEVLEKINSGSNIGACGGMSFPENLEQGKGTTQESNKKSQKK